MGIYDVPATDLIEEIAKDLSQKIAKPAFADYVKSGKHRERAPSRADWWHVRMASVLYRVMKDGPVGTESLRTYYGGNRVRGRAPRRFAKASGKVIRCCLQALEKEGLIKKLKKGRGISPKGEAYMTKKANEIRKKFVAGQKQDAEKLAAEALQRAEREAKARARIEAIAAQQDAKFAKAPAEMAKKPAMEKDAAEGKAGHEGGKKVSDAEKKKQSEEAKSEALAKKAQETSAKLKDKEKAVEHKG